MNLKLLCTIMAALLAVSSAPAVLIGNFTSWDDLIRTSPDIVIARCTVTPQPGVVDCVTWSEIEVVTILKGVTKPSPAKMVSQYVPHQGQWFLMFSTYQSEKLYSAYNAMEEYRIVPLYFDWSEINGKPLAQQIQIVLQHRRDDLRNELKRSNEEMKRLEQGLTK